MSVMAPNDPDAHSDNAVTGFKKTAPPLATSGTPEPMPAMAAASSGMALLSSVSGLQCDTCLSNAYLFLRTLDAPRLANCHTNILKLVISKFLRLVFIHSYFYCKSKRGLCAW